MIKFSLLICLSVLLFLNTSFSRSNNVNQIPNGSKFSCNNCHNSGGTSLNKFGQDVKKSFYTNKNVTWKSELASLDSDGDGINNGKELLDPSGIWKTGDSNPGNINDATNPGDPKSIPTDIDESNSEYSETLFIKGIFPVPAINDLTIELSAKSSDILIVTIYDETGNEIVSYRDYIFETGIIIKKYVLDRNKIPSGIYFISISNTKVNLLKKLIIQ